MIETRADHQGCGYEHQRHCQCGQGKTTRLCREQFGRFPRIGRADAESMSVRYARPGRPRCNPNDAGAWWWAAWSPRRNRDSLVDARHTSQAGRVFPAVPGTREQVSPGSDTAAY